MSIRYKFEIQDKDGNVLIPQSAADTCFMDDGTTAQQNIDDLNALKDGSGAFTALTAGSGRGDATPAENSVALGVGLLANQLNIVVGKYNKVPTAGSPNLLTGDGLVIGNGTSNSNRTNAFRVQYNGNVYATRAYNATGADFAEYFEWADGNPNNEDRRGLFVTLAGSKIALASSKDDYILGVVSANPTVIGNAYGDEWQGKYMTDVFGTRLEECGRPIINPAYKQGLEYTDREHRKEWSPVALVGTVVVCDNGVAVSGDYVLPTSGGVAAVREMRGYKVLKRIDEGHVLVVVK